MPVLFAVTLFLSATLMFWVELMIAKMILPKFGGTPAVWNTCMVFFQGGLLAGYAYAHVTTRWLGVRRQAILHSALLFFPLISLPIVVSEAWAPSPEKDPAPVLLGLLFLSVGLPFFVVAASAPLMQKWFTATGHSAGRDPYFLYAASNLGSMLVLLAYPTLIEPNLPLKLQSWVWAGEYGMLLLLGLACAWAVWRFSPAENARKDPEDSPATDGEDSADYEPKPGIARRLKWVALAFVPSSMMLGVTTYLSTDVAPIPLIWVVPLALYLLTFILVFSRLPYLVHVFLVWALPVLVLVQTFLMLSGVTGHLPWLIPLHLGTFFVVAMVCHGRLAQDRPSPRHLTEFYLWMSVGGVLGGLFNALLAPVVFKTFTEYYLVLVLACLLMAPWGRLWEKPLSFGLDLALPAILGVFACGLIFQLEDPKIAQNETGEFIGQVKAALSTLLPADTPPSYSEVQNILEYGIPCLLCFILAYRPLRLGLGLAAIMLASTYYTTKDERDSLMHRERGFFGILTITRDSHGFHSLTHGHILHGMQRFEPESARHEALTYYHRTGPIGQVFEAIIEPNHKEHIAVVGLGAGTMASYGEPGQEFTFYEINPAVERIARNPSYFTYLSDCRANWSVKLGDARLSLTQAPDHYYDLIAVDAFSSDAIPVHLITREAIELYFDKLREDGILALHISNRYLDLEPVARDLASDLGLLCRVENDNSRTEEEKQHGKSTSTWVLLVRQEADLGPLATDTRWRPPSDQLGPALWTDDFSNILEVFMWQ
jgi:hypothetical protein